MTGSGQTSDLANWILRLQAGDEKAREHLLEIAGDRLSRLTHKMLRNYPGVRRWEQTGDVLQNALLRLHRALGEAKPLSVRHFFNLAAVQIRRELIDLARHYLGPEGLGAHHATDQVFPKVDSAVIAGYETPEPSTFHPNRVDRWTEFHRQVELLPDDEKEVFNLIWYEELSQAEASGVLEISERTLQRRWQSARLKLFEALQGELPV